MPTPITLYN
ncbi:hypothetical protein VCCP10303_0992, partial [Vibrio cholerae CP1030(3)]